MYDQQPIRFHPKSATWRDFNTWFSPELPNRNREWLLDDGSLTARLIKASNKQFAVNVLSQKWQTGQLSECRLLQIPSRQLSLVREVLLLCCGEPWVYARSVIPVTTLQGPLRHLRRFDNRPLGQLLFNTPGMRRSPFQIARLPLSQLPIDQPQPAPTDLVDSSSHGSSHDPLHSEAMVWGRRSRFMMYRKPLLVSEIFLPAFRP